MVLVINGGSSSIKFAIYELDTIPKKIWYGEINRIGLPGVVFIVNGESQALANTSNYPAAIVFLITWLNNNLNIQDIRAIGHRVVHGMQYIEPSLITNELLDKLKAITSYDPDHLPSEIKLIEALKIKYPHIDQFACFDTAFHQTMPRVAKLLPIPRRFDKLGIHRYGFHGLSYSYLMEELERLSGKSIAHGKVIMAHLGNGASLVAVKHGISIDTSMGFTPDSGLPMSTRTGDLDPGVAWFMMKADKLTPKQFSHLISHESGLLGISETSGDMNDLLKAEHSDIRAAEAVGLFCYQVKKWIGAFAAALGGIDTLVFTGGIGVNSPIIRERICDGLGFLGVELNNKRNNVNAAFINTDSCQINIRVMPTDEEIIIAKTVYRFIAKKNKTVSK